MEKLIYGKVLCHYKFYKHQYDDIDGPEAEKKQYETIWIGYIILGWTSWTENFLFIKFYKRTILERFYKFCYQTMNVLLRYFIFNF